MAKKKQKSDKELRTEFFEREAKAYAKRVKPVVIKPENVVETDIEEIEDTADNTENNTEETEETKGE